MFLSDHDMHRRSHEEGQADQLGSGPGALYTRWGRNSCDGEAKLVYAGEILK